MNHFMTLLGEPSSLWASLLGLIAVALAWFAWGTLSQSWALNAKSS
jgi:hypothetical protein